MWDPVTCSNGGILLFESFFALSCSKCGEPVAQGHLNYSVICSAVFLLCHSHEPIKATKKL